MGAAALGDPGPHAGAELRRHAQPLDPLPGAGLPDVGPLGALPEQRRLRLPRPAAGRDGVRLRRAGARAGAPAAGGGATVRRRGRAALVASAERARGPHPLLRRPRLAAVRGGPLRPGHRRPVGARRAGALPPDARPRARTSTRSTTCPRSPRSAASLYEHCLRALRRACTTGAHGLPLIGSGDWNDGMNRVGVEGRGESVWLAWFLAATLRELRPARRVAGRWGGRGGSSAGRRTPMSPRSRPTAGMASGIAGPTTTTAPRSARRRTRSAASTRSPRAGA